MQDNPHHNSFCRIRLRLLCCEAMAAAMCLVIIIDLLVQAVAIGYLFMSPVD